MAWREAGTHGGDEVVHLLGSGLKGKMVVEVSVGWHAQGRFEVGQTAVQAEGWRASWLCFSSSLECGFILQYPLRSRDIPVTEGMERGHTQSARRQGGRSTSFHLGSQILRRAQFA